MISEFWYWWYHAYLTKHMEFEYPLGHLTYQLGSLLVKQNEWGSCIVSILSSACLEVCSYLISSMSATATLQVQHEIDKVMH